MLNQRLVLAVSCLFIALAVYLVLQWRASKDRTAETYPPVEPLPNFDWKEQEPLKFRPFKPYYHMTMGLTTAEVSSLIEMDKNYLDQIKKRRELMDTNPKDTVGANPRVKPAVDEFYGWLVSTYLPTRFPRMFKLEQRDEKAADGSNDNKTKQTHLKNEATQEHYPLTPPEDPVEVLKLIGGLVEDDCQFLLPSEDGDTYTLEGLVCCFPNGFRMTDKLGLKLREIHGPVPHYKEKLEKSNDRYFEKLEVGRFVKRLNWTVSMTPDLFIPDADYLNEGDGNKDKEFDMAKAILRSELQTLHRLPSSKAVLFSFKTYSYPLQEIKDEGKGKALADAIEGVAEGSAPGMHKYKMIDTWGEQTKAWLRN